MRKLLLVILGIGVSLYLTLLIIMYLFQEKLIFFPEKLSKDHQFKFSSPFEEIWIQSEEIQLNSLLFTKAQSKGVILFFHGNAGSLDSWGALQECGGHDRTHRQLILQTQDMLAALAGTPIK